MLSSQFSTGGLLFLSFQTCLAVPAFISSAREHKSIASSFKRAANGPWFTDFPDPGLVQAADGTFYAYATNGNATGTGYAHIPVAFSNAIDSGWARYTADGANADYDALPNLPSWYPPAGGQVWAPDVVQKPNGCYSMLFAGPSDGHTGFCIGSAHSDTPFGPFIPTNAPLHCDDTQSIIDPSHFQDTDGRHYFLFSGAGTLNIMQLNGAQRKTVGESHQILVSNPGDDNANVTEAPFLINAGGTYFLFYSTGTYSQADYTVSYATSQSLLGPYTQQGQLLQTGDAVGGGGSLLGPGGATLINNSNGGYYMAFHALSVVNGPRPLYTASVSIVNGAPVVN